MKEQNIIDTLIPNSPKTNHYVYKYVLDDQWLYVGKSDTGSFTRAFNHGATGDNIDESGWEEIKEADVYYAPLYNSTMADVVESELIRIHKPKYNKAKTHSEWNGIIFHEPEWIPIRTKLSRYIDQLLTEIKDLKISVQEEREKNARIETKQYEDQIKSLNDMIRKLLDDLGLTEKELGIEREKNHKAITKRDIKIRSLEQLLNNQQQQFDRQKLEEQKAREQGYKFFDVLAEYEIGKVINVFAETYDKYHNMISRKHIFTNRQNQLMFSFHCKGYDDVDGYILYSPETQIKNWDVLMKWMNIGDSVYYEI